MTSTRLTSSWHCILACIVTTMAGCVTLPTIDRSAFTRPRTVAIVDVPRMHHAAIVGWVLAATPDFPGFHFTPAADYFFAAGTFPVPMDGATRGGAQAAMQISQMPNAPSPLAAGVGAGVGAFIGATGDETNRRSEAEFAAAVGKLFPQLDMRRDFLDALSHAFRSRGIEARVIGDSPGDPPRIRWPAKEEDGRAYPVSSTNHPPVDADLVIQVSPIAFYNAPTALNPYVRNVSASVIVFEGRAMHFLGRENVHFRWDSSFQYHRYDALVADLGAAVPALRAALLSLAPQVADMVAPAAGK